jgi:ribosome maturation factor RimP
MFLPKEEISNIVAPILEEMQAELVELKLSRNASGFLIKILVDNDHGGIIVAECARLNHKIRQAINNSAIITEEYFLEVSSPGLDRPLFVRNDFLRSLNKRARFFLKEPVSGKIEIAGMIKEVKDESIEVEAGGGIIEIPLSKINKAKPDIDFI